MKIKKIRVQNFRSHRDFILEVGDKSTLIIGPNGSGKTSLIEAIYLALQGTSFRSPDKEIINPELDNWFRIDLRDDNDELRIVKFNNDLISGKKQFEFNGNKKQRITSNMKWPIVLFEPDDLQLLNGSPSRRRRFFDNFISQFNPYYTTILARYNKALKQRNNLLKQPKISQDELFPWNLMLAEYGAKIIENRHKIVDIINELISRVYFEISGSNDSIEIFYETRKYDQNAILSILSQNIERDRLLGFTDFGPHKHDFIFKFNNINAQNIASRGENRSLILALKFIETDILSEKLDRRPIVLLDDVFSELDTTRQKLLTEHFSLYQTIITSTEAVEVKDSIIVRL